MSYSYSNVDRGLYSTHQLLQQLLLKLKITISVFLEGFIRKLQSVAPFTNMV